MTGGAGPRFQFVNRVDELAILRAMLEPEKLPALLVLRAPSGYGKSRLTDELVERAAGADLLFVRVDPDLTPQGDAVTAYDGFFLQQCAAAIDNLAAGPGRGRLDDLQSFLKQRRWTAVRERKLGDTLQKFPSWENLYGVAYEYVERLFAVGRFGRDQLLGSDSREAVAICQAYVEATIERASLALIVRQAEMLDQLSLKALLAFNRNATANLLILEYASSDYGFGRAHDKIIDQELALHPNGHTFQLLKLEPHHVELFLRQLKLPSQIVEWSTSAQWDGNLRRLSQLQHVLTVHTHPRLGGGQPLLRGPTDLEEALVAEVERLSSAERLLLGLIAADPERTERAVLIKVAHRLFPHETVGHLNLLIGALVEGGLVKVIGEAVALADTELPKIFARARGFPAAKALGEAALRDFYVDVLSAPNNETVAPATAMRKALSLAAKTADPQLLLRLLDRCATRIAEASDQTVYVDLVADLAQGDDLLDSERSQLIGWAAGLAYDICDFRKCRTLLEGVTTLGDEERLLLASCRIEDGDHAGARADLAMLDRTRSPPLMLATDLLEGSIALDSGAWDVASMLLRRVALEGMDPAPAMSAHALRLLPEIIPYPECTEVALASVAVFERIGLAACAAYSAMSASRFLAREGRIDEAKRTIAKVEVLQTSVRDEHMIRNNRALIALLSPTPEVGDAIAELQLALRTSRDDFSDLSILSNLAVANTAAGNLEAALDCVARGSRILDCPRFAERDVFWPVCFNFGWVLDAANRRDEASAMRRRPYESGWPMRSGDRYWAWRFGEADTPGEETPYLTRFPYHPVALSHWQLDREAVATLIAAPPR